MAYDSFGGQSRGFHKEQDRLVRIYAVTDQGRRREMEDGCAIATGLPSGVSLVGVFDGHGGDDAARYCSSNLLKLLVRDESFEKGEFRESLHSVFLSTDEGFAGHGSTLSGTTAVVALVKEGRFFVAHAGDSYCSLVKNKQMIHLTKDHVPSNLDEADRARKSKCVVHDGVVSKDGSLSTLAVTRAIGDFEFKDNPKKSREEQAVVADPEILEQEICDGCEFLVLASDGLERKYVESCREEISKALKEKNFEALKEIVARAQSNDNKTMVIVEFLKEDERKKRDATRRDRDPDLGSDLRSKNGDGYDRRRENYRGDDRRRKDNRDYDRKRGRDHRWYPDYDKRRRGYDRRRSRTPERRSKR